MEYLSVASDLIIGSICLLAVVASVCIGYCVNLMITDKPKINYAILVIIIVYVIVSAVLSVAFLGNISDELLDQKEEMTNEYTKNYSADSASSVTCDSVGMDNTHWTQTLRI